MKKENGEANIINTFCLILLTLEFSFCVFLTIATLHFLAVIE